MRKLKYNATHSHSHRLLDLCGQYQAPPAALSTGWIQNSDRHQVRTHQYIYNAVQYGTFRKTMYMVL